MATVAIPDSAPRSIALGTLIRTWLFVAVSDMLFASALGMFVPPRVTAARVFQGVASVLFGKQALSPDGHWALVGLAMHFGVALFWSSIFLFVLLRSAAVRTAIRDGKGFLVAALYGPAIWLIMSLLVIPAMVHHWPTIGLKYWVCLLGHIPFVAMPMVLVNRER
jgi:hypothetical protein